MKDGERLVWAAAFAQGMAGIDFHSEGAVEQMGNAVGRAYAAVMFLRKISQISEHQKHVEGWAMLRDMAGLSN